MKVDKVKSCQENATHSATSQQNNSALDNLLPKYESVFEEGIDKAKGIQANLTFKDYPKPKVEEELNKLEEISIISRVNTSEWATPVVPVIKKNGGVHTCGDFKVTLVDQYPLPWIEGILASLSEGEKCTKLDLRQTYLHMEMSEESRKYLTINTHKGLYQFNRLLFGVAYGPAIWQCSMEQILRGIPGVHCILDDMIVTGKNSYEHLQNLESILSILQENNLKVNLAKCQLTKTERNYSQIDKEALAIIFGIKKFHTYLYGRHFTLITDHQPLLSSFSPTEGLPVTAAARLQRYVVFLAGYSYDIKYRNTKLHTNA